jgi:hypothetical protein
MSGPELSARVRCAATACGRSVSSASARRGRTSSPVSVAAGAGERPSSKRGGLWRGLSDLPPMQARLGGAAIYRPTYQRCRLASAALRALRIEHPGLSWYNPRRSLPRLRAFLVGRWHQRPRRLRTTEGMPASAASSRTWLLRPGRAGAARLPCGRSSRGSARRVSRCPCRSGRSGACPRN